MVNLSEEEVSSSSATPRCEERVTSSFPSCSSSFAATPRWEYDVFLSFRGEDTVTNFTDHLYTALKEKDIKTFKDKEGLERGKSISKLFKVIEESRFAVIVLSENYADSTWCLDELAKIVECMEKRGMPVLPIFYHVDPSDVRHQTGTFAKAFAEETGKRKICSMEEEETWRAALTKVGNLSGCHLRGDRHELEWICQIVKMIFLKLNDKFPGENKIVEEIFQKLCDTFPRVTSLVGICSQVEHLNSLLCVGSNDIRVIGIWGMGGIGKTTLVEVVYDCFSSQFEGCSFIENVKDFSKESDLITLQQHLLADILKKEDICIKNVDDGVNLIKDGLGSKKILLVLDDVNHLDQLKYLANERNWFGYGSRIIITTRDKQLLSAHKVNGLYECKILNNDDALQLFCLKAFEKEQPQEGYEEISWKIVDYVYGLPLALDVLGSLLACRDINYWKSAFKRLKQYPEANIFRSLKMSYDGLNNDKEKSIFIYIACFLRGRNQGLVTDILASLDWPTIGMNVLIERSLITISKDIVQMHVLLRDMAWEILRKQSPVEPGKRRGLRLPKEVFDVLENNEGTNALEIINQDLSIGEVETCSCSPEAFSKMRKLKFLRISNVLFPQGLEFLSNELRILEWSGYPLKSLPSSFHSNEIRKLDMRNSKIEKLWEGTMFFPNLRSIDLSFSEKLTQIPNLTRTPSLETLDLHGCTNLVEWHQPILVHKKLNYLNLASCISLENLPSKIEMESLKTLILSDCSKVKRLPEFGENMKCLKELLLKGTTIEEIPPSIKHLTDIYIFMETQCLPSSSSSTRRWDVFLNFRGADTCMGFMNHLHDALNWNGIKTFKVDREIEIGDSIPFEIMKAIEESMSAIIVFSANYADSTWCLDELVKIVECKHNDKMKLTVLPIFYNVKPSVVRDQKDTFGEAIAKHEKRFSKNMEKVGRWKTALTEVATVSGEEVPARYERKVIKNIIRKICQLLSKCPRVTKGLVGIISQVEKLKLNLDLKSNDVRIIGIWGMGGIGKTTLAEAVYDTFSVEFEGCSFIEKVKERPLLEVQQELLSDICNGKSIPIWNVRDGVKRIKKSLGSKKFLLVLDDVSDKDQLKKLVEWNWFGPNSRIIITTRDRHLLKILKVHDDDIYECERLNDSDALKLLCLKAFEKEQPKQGYENLSRDIVNYASGLPLALDFLGSSLASREIIQWEDALKRVKKHPEEFIFKNLIISYDELQNDTEKNLFLYVACFLKGKNKDLVQDILAGLDVNPIIGMAILEERSLITISDNIVWVHNLLEQMGWKILHKQFLNERIGPKFRKDIIDALTNTELQPRSSSSTAARPQPHTGTAGPQPQAGTPPSLQKKVVLKLELYDDKSKQKAMKAISGLEGVESISMDMKDKRLTVTGDIDPVSIMSKLKKLYHTELVSVGPAKEPEKKDDKKKDPTEKDDKKKDLTEEFIKWITFDAGMYYVS